MNPDSLTSEDLQKFHQFGISKNDKQAKFDLNKVRIMQAEISKTYNAYNTDYRINIGSKNPVQITRAENAKKEEWYFCFKILNLHSNFKTRFVFFVIRKPC